MSVGPGRFVQRFVPLVVQVLGGMALVVVAVAPAARAQTAPPAEPPPAQARPADTAPGDTPPGDTPPGDIAPGATPPGATPPGGPAADGDDGSAREPAAPPVGAPGAAAAPPDPSDPDAAPPAELTPQQVVRWFMSVDPGVALASLDQAIANDRLAGATDRFTAGADLWMPAQYDAYVLPGTPTPSVLHAGTASVSDGGFRLGDPIGGTFETRVAGQLTTTPPVKQGGQTFSATARYKMPLWRNLLGRFYRMEQGFRAERFEARGKDLEAARLSRCAAGLELYAGVWLLQEQTAIWEDLLAFKQRIYERTGRDFRRRMVPRLDWLTAHSDFLAAQQRFQAFEGRRNEALAALRTYLPPDVAGTAFTLATPAAELDEAAAPLAGDKTYTALADEHPAVQGLERDAEALQGEASWVKHSVAPEVSLVPQLGMYGASAIPLNTGPGGAPVYGPLGNATALVGIEVELPLLAPTQRYQARALHRQEEQVRRQRQELSRSFTERMSRAAAQREAVLAQLKILDEKLEIIQSQIGEANTLYKNGRLEFQDFLQHWTIYEEARFERLALLGQRWALDLEVMRAGGQAPAVCREAI